MQIAKKHFVSPESLRKLLDFKTAPYIGTLPKELLLCTSLPKAVLETLDKLAFALRELNTDNLAPFKIKFGNKEVICYSVNAGDYGRVFRLAMDDKSFAFKVFHNNSIVDIHGAYAEISSGLFLSNWKIKDLSRFYCGNPEAGWSLDSWVSSGSESLVCKGKSLDDLLERFDLEFVDRDVNRNANEKRIWWDRGGIYKKSRFKEHSQEAEVTQELEVTINNLEDYSNLLKNLETRISAVRGIKNIPISQIKDAFKMTLEYEDTRNMLIYINDYLPEEERMWLFDEMMKYPELRENALFIINYLSMNERSIAFKEGLKYDESRIPVTYKITSMPVAERKDLVEFAISNYPETREMIAYMIYFLPKEVVQSAFDFAMEYPECRLQLLGKINDLNLPKDFLKDKLCKLIEESSYEKGLLIKFV